MPEDDFAHVLPNAGTCAMSVYVTSPDVSGATRAASADIDVNGTSIGHLRFTSLEPDFSIAGDGHVAPADLRPEAIPMTPLYNPRGLVFPIAASFCTARHWDIRISVRGARWPIDRVGILAQFSPSRATLTPSIFDMLVTIAIVCGLLIGTHALFERVEREFGVVALLLVLGIFACALVTHDEWDFSVWLRFVDFVAIGHANPALMWGGSPLWPSFAALLAPVLSTSYALTGNGSQQVTALFFKLAMAIAACSNAVLLARFAKPSLRRFYFPLLLLAPYGLYQLAGGYREIFAGSFFLIGASLALRGRYAFAALAFAAATSISESLVAILFLPAALRLSVGNKTARDFGSAFVALVAGVGPLVLEWIVLEPHGVVSNTLSSRITAPYRFGGGSWLSTLDGFGLLPPWVGIHAAAITLGLLALLAIPLTVVTWRDVFARDIGEPQRRKRVFRHFIGYVAAFFLAYHGIDPSTWYALWVATAFYFITFEGLSPFPLFLSALQAFAFYAILGIGDFANATYVMPTNAALLGVLGNPMLIGILTVNLAILALYVSCLIGRPAPLFGRGSIAFSLLFFCAAGAAAIKMYPIDIVFCTAAGVAILIAFARLSRVDERAVERTRVALLDYTGLAGAIVVGVWGGTHNPAAGLVAIVAMLLGLTYGFGMCDVVLTIGGTLLVGTQYGFGWVSIGGYIILSLLAVASIWKARTVSLPRSA
jgi:hypothetical protein